MSGSLSAMTWDAYNALPIDEKRRRRVVAEKYRRWGRESSPEVRAVARRILQGEECEICGSGQRTSVDHITPLVLGGTHAAANLRILCGSCNSRKGARA